MDFGSIILNFDAIIDDFLQRETETQWIHLLLSQWDGDGVQTRVVGQGDGSMWEGACGIRYSKTYVKRKGMGKLEQKQA